MNVFYYVSIRTISLLKYYLRVIIAILIPIAIVISNKGKHVLKLYCLQQYMLIIVFSLIHAVDIFAISDVLKSNLAHGICVLFNRFILSYTIENLTLLHNTCAIKWNVSLSIIEYLALLYLKSRAGCAVIHIWLTSLLFRVCLKFLKFMSSWFMSSFPCCYWKWP